MTWSEPTKTRFSIVRAARSRSPPCRAHAEPNRARPLEPLSLSELGVLSGGAEPAMASSLPCEALTEPQRAFVVPGSPVERAALGYLHANCGHCHNSRGSARPDTDLDLRLDVMDLSASAASAATSTRLKPLQWFRATAGELRVAPGAPERSALLSRMDQRGNPAQMPPLGTEQRDAAGVAAVRAWIEAL